MFYFLFHMAKKINKNELIIHSNWMTEWMNAWQWSFSIHKYQEKALDFSCLCPYLWYIFFLPRILSSLDFYFYINCLSDCRPRYIPMWRDKTYITPITYISEGMTGNECTRAKHFHTHRKHKKFQQQRKQQTHTQKQRKNILSTTTQHWHKSYFSPSSLPPLYFFVGSGGKKLTAKCNFQPR